MSLLPPPYSLYSCDKMRRKQNVAIIQTTSLVFQVSVPYYPARALRALGLLLADGAPTVGRLFEPSAKFFYGNSCNSGTESRKSFLRSEINRRAEG